MSTYDSQTTEQILAQIKEHYLLRGVPDDARHDFIALMKQHVYGPGEHLFRQGDTGASLFIILSGKVRILIRDQSNPGTEIPLRDFQPVRTLGELALLDEQPRSASAVAVERSTALELHRDDFLDFVNTRPVVGLMMMRDLVERVRYTTDYVQQVVTATTRLAEDGIEGALETAPESKQDEEIGHLIQAFVDMVQSVKARAQTLRGGSESG